MLRGRGSNGADRKAVAVTSRLPANRRPRYDQIFRILHERIARGVLPIGTLLPTEAQICADFGVSRFTAREALRRLVDSGMIARRKGSGSYVTATQPQIVYVHSMHSLSELFQYALDTRFDISRVRTVRIDATTGETLAAEAGSRWLSVEGVRRTKGTDAPICYTRVFINSRFAPVLADVRSLEMPIYAAIEQRSGEIIAEAVQEIRAVRMTAAIAAATGAPHNGPGLIVSCRYIGLSGATLLCSFNWHPAERFRFNMHIRRGTFNVPRE